MNNQSIQPRRSGNVSAVLRIVIIVVFFVAVVASTSAIADPTSALGETTEGVFGEGIIGHGQPDSKTGVMNWTYPFSLPAARGGPQPQLMLNYNSSSHDREAGYGWGLDIPVIERKPLSGNPCFKDGNPIACGEQRKDASGAPVTEERYTYNGQPLVFICTLPNSNCGNEPQPDWAQNSGWRYFRLQVEGQFSRFYLSDDRRYWRVQLKGGELLEFGSPPDSSTPGIEHPFGNNKAILRWRLVRHSDAVHKVSGKPVNYIDYRWKRLGKRGLLYLTDIYDTPRANGPRSDTGFAHHTQLTWKQPNFPQTHYADPHHATPDLRLSRVAVASMPWSGAGPREIIRTYLLNYASLQGTEATIPSENPVRFQLWHHSFLSEIQMEGRCGQFEDDKGYIPEDRECKYRLPPTTFEYEGANGAFGSTFITHVQGGPSNPVDEYEVLPYLNSVGVVDFNRDGLPDVVQSWNNEFCKYPLEGKSKAIAPVTTLIAGSDVADDQKDSILCVYNTRELRANSSSRPIIGYLNLGISNGTQVELAYQCMDAGRFDDQSGLTFYNTGHFPGFLTTIGPSKATTILGSWGEGIAAWSNAQYAPFRARPLMPGSKPSEFQPGTGCKLFKVEAGPYDFKEADFHPGWKWEKTRDNDWPKHAPGKSEQDPPIPPDQPELGSPRVPRWFSDIDGDGLTDRLDSTDQLAGDFNTAFVQFTQRYAKHEPLPIQGEGPAQVPFVSDPAQLPHSLAPNVAGSKRGTKYYYVDINGDGLVDLVTINSKDGSGIPRVRPGNGYGEFMCIGSLQPWPCKELPTEAAAVYEIEVLGASKLSPSYGEYQDMLGYVGYYERLLKLKLQPSYSKYQDELEKDTFFHDVTADGLADIVQYDKYTGKVRLWVNQDGHTFACVTGSCVVGVVLDERTATPAIFSNFGDHRTTFADMNADGTDDIAILTNRGAYIGLFGQTPLIFPSLDKGGAPRPGLLTRIHNGYGATTDIQYQTIQQLDLAAKKAGPAFAWEYHSPVVENIVTQIVTQDSYHANNLSGTQFSAPYQFKRTAQYAYQNPAYDRWSRSFAGFRKVFAHYGDEMATTATTYWFGPCQNNALNTQDIPLCPGGSDDDTYKSLTGRAVRIDRGNAPFFFNTGYTWGRQLEIGGSKLLWTKIFQYSNEILFDRSDRRVTFSYPKQIDTYLYDDAQPTKRGGKISPLAESDEVAGGDVLENASNQKGIRKHLSRLVEYDQLGTLKRVTDKGAVKDEDSKPTDIADITTIALFSPKSNAQPDGPNNSLDTPEILPCTSDWQCLPDIISIWEPRPVLGAIHQDKLLRKSRFTYNDATKDIQSVEGWLDGQSISLDRHHPMGNNSTAPKPPGQSPNKGWHTLATLKYDTWGNVTRTVSGQSAGGSPASCTTIIYDGPYQYLPNFVERFTDGCNGSALETQSVFDRGFEQIVSSIAPTGSSTDIHYDPFGRLIEVYLPNPNATSGNQNPILAATIAYSDRSPLSLVDVRRNVGFGKSIRSVSILNGLGEPVVAFDQGDNNDWILHDWRETNLTGQVVKARRPWAYTGDPIATAVNANNLPIPSDNAFFEINYDDFGRQISMKEKGTTGAVNFSIELMRTSYFPLALETRDAEQLKTGSLHGQAFQRIEFDGHGRSTRGVQHIGNPITDNIVTSIQYKSTGEPGAITRTHAGNTYKRTMEYDSLGRLIVNKEPNTGNNLRYAWDDAGRLVGTSDARGCGENFHYDGLNRLIGEDYSPCLASQPAYTSPNLATGEGLETFYRYDTYEANQVSPEPGFTDDPKFALGNLVAVSDRGSHTRFNYDARGRIRRISRQVAKPNASGNNSPYAPHWFTSRMDFDLGDRLERRTTGVDVAELLMNGTSEERYTYSPRGLPLSITSSYGPLVEKIVYDSDSAPNSITYGDYYGTRAKLEYDGRRRLIRYDLTNTKSYPPFWLPALTYFDYRFSEYDEVGNPQVIEDTSRGLISSITSNSLPPEAAPVQKRKMEYDDLYRLIRIDNTYKVPGGIAPWRSPFESEINTGDRHPVPLRSLPTRVAQQTFDYDGLGNLTASSDDLKVLYDRSLGPNLGYGTPLNGPNQLQSGKGLQVRYDEAGNLSELKLTRHGNCPTGTADQCAQWFAYDWDEVGQLARARRWDFDGSALPPQASPNALPTEKPSWDLTYAYSQGARVRKSVVDATDVTRHTLEVLDTLRIEQASFDSTDENYKVKPDNLHAYLGGMAHVFWDTENQFPHQAPDSLITMHLNMGDQLGSSSVVINHANSELVERTTYQPYGAVESDYRPSKRKAFREPYKFTGKEEDIEVSATYFGARYYQPYLGRFMSADPLTIHGLGSDLNPYAYVGGQVFSSIDPIGLDSDVYDPPPRTPEEQAAWNQTLLQAGGNGCLGTECIPREPTTPIPSVPQDFAPKRGDVSASGSPDQPSAASRTLMGLGQNLKKVAFDMALDLVDPFRVNRNFVKNVLTVFDKKASTTSKSIAAGSTILAVIPVVGELKIVSGGLARILSSTASSEELAHAVSSVGGGGFQQTIAVLETGEGVRLVGGGVRDLSPLQRIYASARGLVPVKLYGAHAEETVLTRALEMGYTPLRGVTTIGICGRCAFQLSESYGLVIEAIEGEKVFTVLPGAR